MNQLNRKDAKTLRIMRPYLSIFLECSLLFAPLRLCGSNIV